jgi:hypothetical protein
MEAGDGRRSSEIETSEIEVEADGGWRWATLFRDRDIRNQRQWGNFALARDRSGAVQRRDRRIQRDMVVCPAVVDRPILKQRKVLNRL